MKIQFLFRIIESFSYGVPAVILVAPFEVATAPKDICQSYAPNQNQAGHQKQTTLTRAVTLEYRILFSGFKIRRI